MNSVYYIKHAVHEGFYLPHTLTSWPFLFWNTQGGMWEGACHQRECNMHGAPSNLPQCAGNKDFHCISVDLSTRSFCLLVNMCARCNLQPHLLCCTLGKLQGEEVTISKPALSFKKFSCQISTLSKQQI